MKFEEIGSRSSDWLREMAQNVLQPRTTPVTAGQRLGQLTRQGLALLLSALMIMIPMGQSEAFAQSEQQPGTEQAGLPDDSQQAPQGQPLSAAQLDQLVAPIALYPDALVAQVLTAATYPTQVVEADRWRQAQGNAPPEQIAAGADARNWDPSVKALVAFPTVLAQMDKNLQWTTDLGNAYYNQPQDVMDSVQAMRQKAQTAGQLRSTPQQTVTTDNGAIAIAPANPTVVYVPVYDPWAVYGAPFPMYPGYYYGPPPGIFWGGLAIGFGVGIGIGVFSHWGWGWGHWGMGWHGPWGGGWGRGRGVFYNHNTYITRSSTVVNRGFSRPGAPPRGFAGARGSYARPGAGFNRGGAGANRGGAGFNRGGASVNRPGGSRAGAGVNRPSGSRAGAGVNRPSGSRAGAGMNRQGGVNNATRPGGTVNRPGGASAGRPSGSYGRQGGAPGASQRAPAGRAQGGPSGASRPSTASRPAGGPSGGGHASSGGGHSGGGGGHEGHGR